MHVHTAMVAFGFYALVIITISVANANVDRGNIIYAINAGGKEHVDINGIRYMRDRWKGKNIIGQEEIKNTVINGVPHKDQILYYNARYTTNQVFRYEVDIKEDGHYMLVLKFCETMHSASSQRIFSVTVNINVTVLQDFDIFAKTGKYTAYDVHIPLDISNVTKLMVEFWKGTDSPTVSAFYIMKGILRDVPPLIRIPPEKILFAVNCGGDTFIDTLGIGYRSDKIDGSGITEQYADDIIIDKSVENDQQLYRTERYTLGTTIDFEVSIKEEGDYVAVFKFCENYYTKHWRKFSILINGNTMAENLDVLSKAGFGTAYNIFFQFKIIDGMITNGFFRRTLYGNNTVRFTLKQVSENPMINALYVMRGRIGDLSPNRTTYAQKVVYAVNAGGSEGHVDINGIYYQPDPRLNKHFEDIKQLRNSEKDTSKVIVGVPQHDKILYKSEMSAFDEIYYDVLLPSDGDYVLVLKFCEQTFFKSKKRVLDVLINNKHKIIQDLDIVTKVGDWNIVYDAKVEFEIAQGQFLYENETSQLENNMIMRVSICKGPAGNPFLNAMYVIKGNIDDVPSIYGGIEMDQRSMKEKIASFKIGNDVPGNYDVKTGPTETKETEEEKEEPDAEKDEEEMGFEIDLRETSENNNKLNINNNYANDKLHVIFAINAGGNQHTDINGIEYSQDPLLSFGNKGNTLDVGVNTSICGASKNDQYLYQTQRSTYSFNTHFSYELPYGFAHSSENSEYVFIFKFCVLRKSFRDESVFDIVVNGCYLRRALNIRQKNKNRITHDEVVRFFFSNNSVQCDDYDQFYKRGVFLQISFKSVKGYAFLNAMCLIKGKLEDVPAIFYVQEKDKKDCDQTDYEEITMKSQGIVSVTGLDRRFVNFVLMYCFHLMIRYIVYYKYLSL